MPIWRSYPRTPLIARGCDCPRGYISPPGMPVTLEWPRFGLVRRVQCAGINERVFVALPSLQLVAARSVCALFGPRASQARVDGRASRRVAGAACGDHQDGEHRTGHLLDDVYNDLASALNAGSLDACQVQDASESLIGRADLTDCPSPVHNGLWRQVRTKGSVIRPDRSLFRSRADEQPRGPSQPWLSTQLGHSPSGRLMSWLEG